MAFSALRYQQHGGTWLSADGIALANAGRMPAILDWLVARGS